MSDSDDLDDVVDLDELDGVDLGESLDDLDIDDERSSSTRRDRARPDARPTPAPGWMTTSSR
jgi:hypothetical protein